MSKILLIDTTVVNDTADTKGDEPRKVAYKEYLEDDVFKKYEPAISCIVRYEAFAGSNLETALKVKTFVDKLRTFEVDKQVLNVAAVLDSCYRKHEAVKSHASAISLPDKVIAATVILTQAYVLTTDFNDFPRPFFVEETRKTLSYTRADGKQYTREIYILRPDTKAYNDCFRQCYPKGYNKDDEQTPA